MSEPNIYLTPHEVEHLAAMMYYELKGYEEDEFRPAMLKLFDKLNKLHSELRRLT